MTQQILVADDSVTIRKAIGMLFSTEAYAVTMVDNGLDAIARAQELRPALVIADCAMPGRSGYDVCEALKSSPATAHIPVMLLAGTFEPFDENRARAARADGFLPKPFDSTTFLEKVRAFVGAAPASQAPAPQAPAPAPAAAARPPVAGMPGRPLVPGSVAGVPVARPAGVPPGVPAGLPPRGLPPRPGMAPPPPAASLPRAGGAPPPPGAPLPGAPRPPGGLPPAGLPPRAPTSPGLPRPPVAGMPQGYRPPGASVLPGQRKDPFGLATQAPGPTESLHLDEPPSPVPMATQGGARPAAPQPMPLPVAAAPAPAAPAADGGEALLRQALSRASKEVIEKIAWEVVPQLAETIIREELDRLVKERDAKGLA